METQFKQQKRYRRHRRIRAKIFGTKERPRLCVFRSAKHIYAQLIDDAKGVTLASTSDLELIPRPKQRRKTKLSPKTIQKDTKNLSAKASIAYEVGKLLAEKALRKKIGKVVFDRGGYAYQGRVKALAEGAREGGLNL